jgi:2,3-bisphosphoglycerate-independent phosphoglycerate mutase
MCVRVCVCVYVCTRVFDCVSLVVFWPNLSLPVTGLAPPGPGNAIELAATPTMDAFRANAGQYATLEAHQFAVGLPEGVMGNSEVGHLTMGAGQVQFQDLARINLAIKDGSFATNATTLAALHRAKSGNGRVHFLGLVSDGSVHSHIEHLYSFLGLAKAHQIPNAFVHFIADGRGTIAAVSSWTWEERRCGPW